MKSIIQNGMIPVGIQSQDNKFQISRPCEVRRSGQVTTFVVCAVLSWSFQAVALLTKTAINRRFFQLSLQSVSWILAEFYFNRGLQRLYTGTCIILQKTINGFLCLLIVFLKSKTYQLILKDVIKLNRNLG